MTEQEILENLETILYTAKYTNEPPGWKFYFRKVEGSLMGDPVTEYYNETVELLRALYQKLNKKEKEYLLHILEPKNPLTLLFLANQPKCNGLIFSRQDFIFMFYVKIKEIDKALKLIRDRVIINEAKVNILRVLYEVLQIEPEIFDSPKLKQILSIIDSFNNFLIDLRHFLVDSQKSIDGQIWIPAYDKTKIADYKASDNTQIVACEQLLKIIENRLFIIKKERLSASLFEGVNFEINQDQTQLQNVITEFGFDKELNEIISKVNEKLYNAKDSFDFKNCIDLIRAFFETLCISIALEIQNKKQITPSESIDKMGKAENYFLDKRVKFLTQAEHDLIVKFNGFISSKGVHALQSETEYARISRNLAIELGLFLMEKLRKYLTESTN